MAIEIFENFVKDCHENNKNKILVVTWVGLCVNFSLSIIKLIFGIFGKSHVVIADAIHSLSDLSTDLAIIIGVKFWTKPADKEHPHGHHKIEMLVTLSIGAFLVATASGILWDSISTLHEQHTTPPKRIAFVAALISIIAKEILYHWTASVGRKVKSSALIANAWHHRSDAMSSVITAIAVFTATISPDWAFTDHIGAIVVSFFIYQAAFKIVWSAVTKLIDTGVSKKEHSKIYNLVIDTQGVHNVHDIRTRYIGSANVAIDLHIAVNGNMTVNEAHEIYRTVKNKLLTSDLSIVDVVIHVDPYIIRLGE